ncbi:TPA: hypothetical protein ACH3X1_010881 [Trebouxia sp. C0004]
MASAREDMFFSKAPLTPEEKLGRYPQHQPPRKKNGKGCSSICLGLHGGWQPRAAAGAAGAVDDNLPKLMKALSPDMAP